MKVKVIKFSHDSDPMVVELEPTLEAMQALVGGYIEIVPLRSDGLELCCNEEGKFKDLPPTVDIFGGQDTVVGDCALMRHDDEGEMVSVTAEDIAEFVGRGRIREIEC